MKCEEGCDIGNTYYVKEDTGETFCEQHAPPGAKKKQKIYS